MSSVRWAFCTKKWIPTKSEWLHALACIQDEERDRVMKFVYKKDAKSALIGRLLLKKVIVENTSIPYSAIKLGRTERGKPYLLHAKESLNFNISHQGDFVVLAAESSRNVGVDVMKTEIKGNQTIPEFFHTMRRQFTPHEWQTIKQNPSDFKQLEMFMRHWCLKESYVKALGVGIGLLKKLQFMEFHIAPQSTELNDRVSRVYLLSFGKEIFRETRLGFARAKERLPVEWSDHRSGMDTKLFLESKPCDEWCFQETKLDEDHQVVVALHQSNSPQENENLQNGTFILLTIKDLLPPSMSFQTVNEMFWKEFEEKSESS
ncbi:L-aminoadipate-semialdehyde dehydrogenase-phosphopantetheinyl transferase-like [Dendronephthya gigantea]|uniref:L-aminoadipate-semialdehyde dehydrogenase-phosphopantetheinyl transferase-like n=1 Tax=Dendronephthya gigantea TaxID=151771 RepID=UPI00106C7D9A|nr:L-aminoadipate-semialdehyde dehydrogenase-phosphopantetheinyl transferase-like [Dendronephthya gigantea]